MGTVAMGLRPSVSVAAGSAYLVLLGAGIISGLTPLEDDGFYVYLVSLTATVMLGYGIALGRIRAGLAERRATELAREHDERTQAAVAQEQARIAREVHDIVAHDVSVIVAQAAAAHRLLPDEDPAAPTLQAIETVGRDALDGLRRLVPLLRTNGGEALRSPQPTLARLPALLTQVRAAGLPVELVVHGQARELPGTVETNAYRIVQEGLTNALKHAGPARATVVLDYRADALRVEVRDDGRGAAAAPVPALSGGGTSVPTGFGLVSMQQRAALLDGQMEVGPGERGGFRVTVLLPLEAG
jgi:signal transduction histidine kinase